MSVLVPQKSERGWIVELPDDFVEELGQEKGAIAVMYAWEGGIKTEVIPAPEPELENAIDRIYEKYKDAFAEMKRLGD
jgi:hypothetical protein